MVKIPVTLTILDGFPDVAWQNVNLFLRDTSIAHTPAQAVAAICWQYYIAVYDDGFSGFLNLYRVADKDKFTEVFTTLGIWEMIAPLAVWAETGREVEEDELEEWFDANAPVWAAAVQKYVEDHADDFFEIVDEDYTVVPHKMIFPLSAIMAAVVLGFMTAIALTQTIVVYSLFFLIFFVIASPFVALALYGLFWRISVKKDVITIHQPLQRKRMLHISEITKVKMKHGRFAIYAHGKKVATVRSESSFFTMLFTQLSLAGKVEEASLDRIVVRQQTSAIITAFLWPMAVGAFFAQSLLRKINPAGVYEIAFFLALLLIALLYCLMCPWRYIFADQDSLIVIKMLGNEIIYPIASITKVNGHSESMTIYTGRKKIATINARCEGSQTLFRRLREELFGPEEEGG